MVPRWTVNLEGQQTIVIYTYGEQRWYQNNKLHRDDDQPAII